ncbi:MAG: oligosaccharide flippase family protein [Acidobacteriota bacterium]|nr:oligosaccharide flippase family protein [Acidobacteriota bacterium]
MSSISMLKKLAGESVIYGLSGIISRFVGVFLVPVYTRFFVPADYGVISLVTNLFGLLTFLAVLGLDDALHRWYYESESEEDRKKTLNTFLWSYIAFAAFFSAVLAIFHNFFAARILKEPQAATPILIAAINFPLMISVVFTSNLLRIQRRAVNTSVFLLTTSLITILLNVVFVVFLRAGIVSIFYAQIITSSIATVWTLVLFKHLISPKYFDWQRWKEMISFGYPLIPANISYWVINLSGVYFIQSFANTREVGLYQVGSAVATAMALLTGAFQMAWGPFAISIHKQPDAKRIYALALQLYLGVASLAAVLLTLFASEILIILTTESYFDAYLVAGILAFNYLVIGLGYIAMIGGNIAKNNKSFGIAAVVSACLLISLNLILVPIYGKEGAAISTLVSQIVIPIAVFWQTQKFYPVPYNFGKAVLIFLSGLSVGFGVLSLIKEAAVDFYPGIAFKILAALLYSAFLFWILKSEIYSSKNITGELFQGEP